MNPEPEQLWCDDRWPRPKDQAENSRAWLIALTAAALGLLVVFNSGCTTRQIEYNGVRYKHTSFLTESSVGKLGVVVSTNGIASVTIENFANDQVSAMREAKELVKELNSLKTPTP